MRFIKQNFLEVHRVLKSCADSTIKVFLPIIIYQKTSDLRLVFLFLIIYYFVWGLGNIVFKKSIVKKPLFLIIIHIFPIILTHFLISFFTLNLALTILIAFLMGLSGVFYSIPINIIFALKDKTSNVAKFDSSSIFGKILFTLLTGFLIGSQFKQSLVIVLILSLTLYSLSIMPLFLNYKQIKNSAKANSTDLKEFNKTIKDNKNYNYLFVFFGIFQNIIDTFLPLYLYIFNFKIEQVALVIVLSDIAKIASNYFVKYLIRKNKDSWGLLFAIIVFIATIISIPFVKNPNYYYAVSILLPLTFSFVHVSIFTRYLKKIKAESNIQNALIVRDVFVLTPRSLLYSLFFIFPIFLPIFITGAASATMLLAFNVKILKEEKKQFSNNELLEDMIIETTDIK